VKLDLEINNSMKFRKYCFTWHNLSVPQELEVEDRKVVID